MKAEPPVSLWPDPEALGTVTDLYELTMMAGYYASEMAGRRATFELFVRKMPEGRAYLVFAGLEQAIGDVLSLAFTAEQIEAIREWPPFRHLDSSVMKALAGLRFEGEVWSVPEGTVVFDGETIVRVTAALPQAQWVETLLLASLSYPTLVASKAARIVAAARGRSLFEYGARRGHGPLAGMLAARAAYIAGFDGTSLVRRPRAASVFRLSEPWLTRGFNLSTPKQPPSRRTRAYSLQTRHSSSTLMTRSKVCAAPLRSNRPSGLSGSIAVSWGPLRARHARSSINTTARPSRSSPRGISTNTGSPSSRPRAYLSTPSGSGPSWSLPATPPRWQWSTSSSSWKERRSSSSARARGTTPSPSRFSVAVTSTAGSAATMSFGRMSLPRRAAARTGHSIKVDSSRNCRPSRASAAAAESSSPRSPIGFCCWTLGLTIRSPTASG